jgi:hypothetical protein
MAKHPTGLPLLLTFALATANAETSCIGCGFLLLTFALATAMTIFAPSLAMPPASYFLPTMKPVMFCEAAAAATAVAAAAVAAADHQCSTCSRDSGLIPM